MTPRAFGFIAAAAACLCTGASLPAQSHLATSPPGHSATPSLREIIGVAQVVDVQLSPDGKRVVYEVRRTRWASNRYVTELWLRPTDGRGAPVKLVTGTPTTSAYQSLKARWSPDSRRLAYFSDRDGGNQIWLLNPDTRATEPLTRLARWQAVDPRTVQPAFFRWSPDSRSLAFAAFWPIKPDSTRDFNTLNRGLSVGVDWTSENPFPGARPTTNASLWVVDVASHRVRRLTDDSLHVADVAWSPDGSRIAFSAGARPEDVPYKSDLYLLDVRSRAVKLLVAQPGWDAVPEWSPDGRWIAFESQRGRVDWNYSSYLTVISPEGGEPRYLAPGFDEQVANWPHLLGWARDSRSIYFHAYVRLGQQVYRAALDGGSAEPVTSSTRFLDHFSLAPAAAAIAVTAEDPVTPPDVYLSPLEGFAPRRVTEVNPGWAAFPKPAIDTVVWRSRDGRFDVEGVLIRPAGAAEGTRAPLLVFLEGGPSSIRAGFQFDDIAQYPLIAFANQGYLVFAPGSRGRPGSGKAYRQTMPDHSDFLPGPYEDVMAGVDHLIAAGMVDTARMGVMGFSYGGALSAYTITRTDRFRAVSINEGPANFLRYAVTVAGQRDRLAILHDQAGFGSPWHPDSLRTLLDQSGIFRMDRVRTPTLLEFGATSLAEPDGIEMFGVLQRFRVPSQLIVYPRTGHGIEEPLLREDSYRRNVEWFDYWVRGQGEDPLAGSSRP